MDMIARLGEMLRLRKIAAVAVIPAAVTALALAPAAPTFASTGHTRLSYSSYIYTQPGRPSALATCWSGCGTTGRPIYPANGTSTGMICWWDSSSSYDGNYPSNRWFHVNITGQPGQWFIHSSYVYYQTKVPPCPS